MLDSTKLNEMIVSSYGSVAGYCRHQTKIPYTTMKTSLSTNERLAKMPIDNFLLVAHDLGMSADELYDLIEIN